MFKSLSHSLFRPLLAGLIVGQTLTFATLAQAFIQSDVDEFLGTGRCFSCDLSNADFSANPNVRISRLLFSNLIGADFFASTLSPRDIVTHLIDNNDFSNAIFEFAGIDRLFFSNNDFLGTNFNEAIIVEASFFGNDFTGSDFLGTVIVDSVFDDNTLNNVSFDDALLDNVEFRTNFVGSSFANTTARNSSFVNADFTDVNFSSANFSNVDLTGSNLTDEQLASFESFTGILPDGTTVGIPESSNLLGLLGTGLTLTFLSFRKKNIKSID